ncbi:MAG: DUF1722 domain-containing protein [Candidatus Magnetomorum sp.]|nr:DUF1722 domain-containing protein [Candidatus Magnetomorum sp.]
MRIWDIQPGYLNRQSLLGEHRELHGIVSIIVNQKKGYSKHPETLRWVGYGWALRKRHQLLAAEMSFRGFTDKSPVLIRANQDKWPDIYIDEPYQQFQILSEKYKNKDQGRIPLPQNARELWQHHKYSVLARDVNLYKQLGRTVSSMKPFDDFSELAKTIVELLKKEPSIGGARNALQHMWGYVSEYYHTKPWDVDSWSLARLIETMQQLTIEIQEPYLMTSTALSELGAWIR